MRLGGLAAVYYALAWVGLRFADNVASPVWPAAGLAVAAMALWGRRALPAIFLGSLLIEASGPVPLRWALVMAAGATAGAAVGGWVVARAGGSQVFQTLGGVPRFGAAAFAAAVPAACLGTASLAAAGIVVGVPDVVRTFTTWSLGDLVGIVTVAPVLLGLAGQAWRWPTAREAAEGVAVALALGTASFVVFGLYAAPLAFLVVAPVVWIALRFGPLPTAGALLGLHAAAVAGTLAGHGPFVGGPPGAAFLILQAFMVTLSLFCLALAALSVERRRSAVDLERRVAERTRSLADLNLRLQREVLERRAAQHAVNEAQHIAKLGSWTWDIQANRVTWSDELRVLAGLGQHDPVDVATSIAITHPEDRARVQAAIQAAREAGAPFIFDQRIVRADGAVLHLHVEGRTDVGADGKAVRMVGVSQDVTERRAAEAAMAEAQQVAHMGTWRWDVSKPHAVWSDELYRIYGLDPAKHVPSYEDYLVRVHPDDVERVKAATQAVFEHHQPYSHDERVRHTDGSWRNLHTWAHAVKDAHGNLVALVGACQDVTERFAQEAAREEATRQEREARLEMRRLQGLADFKTHFLRTAAHELGTPLTPIKIQLRVLRDLVAKRPTLEEAKAVAILERNVDRLQLLVRDLLESARMQSGRLRLNPRSMDLAHAVHDVVETFQEPAIKSGIALDAKMPPELAMVGDPDRITQVLYNLLSNAMKFTPAGGRVHVQADDLGEAVRFTVQDTGTGFSPQQAAELFLPFSQVHDRANVPKAGSGLGLYICKGIVEQHGGAIAAHSDGPGMGARFTVTLPCVARPPPVSEAVIDPKIADPPSSK